MQVAASLRWPHLRGIFLRAQSAVSAGGHSSRACSSLERTPPRGCLASERWPSWRPSSAASPAARPALFEPCAASFSGSSSSWCASAAQLPRSPPREILRRPPREILRSRALAASASAQRALEAAVLPGRLSDESINVTADGRLRLATLEGAGTPRTVAVCKDGKLWPIGACVPRNLEAKLGSGAWSDMSSVVEAWDTIRPRLHFDPSAALSLDSVRVLAPLPRLAGPVMCIGKNYAEHVKEVDTWKTAPGITQPSIPEHPIVFTKSPQAVVGTGEPILLPPAHVSSQVDYEAEVAVVIGRTGRAISEEEAMSYVFGYTILNDVTARDVQKKHQQWFLGKSCDSFCPMGPWLVPAAEVDGAALGVKCWVNDELRQNGNTSQLIFPIPTLIATISKAMTLRPGDIIATGTPSGVGSGFNPPKHLRAGDVVRIQVEGLGELVNRVLAP